MIEIEGKSNYSKLEFKFKKRSVGITPSKDIHLPVSTATAIDCKMVRKPSDLSDSPVVVKMTTQKDCLPQTLSCIGKWQNTHHKYWSGRITPS